MLPVLGVVRVRPPPAPSMDGCERDPRELADRSHHRLRLGHERLVANLQVPVPEGRAISAPGRHESPPRGRRPEDVPGPEAHADPGERRHREGRGGYAGTLRQGRARRAGAARGRRRGSCPPNARPLHGRRTPGRGGPGPPRRIGTIEVARDSAAAASASPAAWRGFGPRGRGPRRPSRDLPRRGRTSGMKWDSGGIESPGSARSRSRGREVPLRGQPTMKIGAAAHRDYYRRPLCGPSGPVRATS